MDTATNSRVTYDKTMEEFTDDVKYRLENAYELVKERGDFRARLYHEANMDYSTVSDACCNFCELAKDYEKYGYCEICDRYRYMYESEPRYDYDYYWKEREERCRQRKLYREMNKFDTFDAFLTEPVKNAICEDILGEILTFL